MISTSASDGADGAQPVAQVDHDRARPGSRASMSSRWPATARSRRFSITSARWSSARRSTATQRLRGEGLFDEVVGAAPHRLDRELDVGMAGDQDHRQVGVDLAQALQQRHAVHAGHADVGDDDAVEARADEVERLLGAGEGADTASPARSSACSVDRRICLVVVDQQHGLPASFRRHRCSALGGGAAPA